MDALRPVSPIHYYDTHLHGIACGLRGFEQRSTKHARGVTCDACLGALRERPSASKAPTSDAYAADGAAAP